MPISYSVLTEHLLTGLCCSSCTVLLKLPSDSRPQLGTEGSFVCEIQAMPSLRPAYKILHFPAPKENGRDTDNTQRCSPAGMEQRSSDSFVV